MTGNQVICDGPPLERLPALDAVRGMLALVVVLGHVALAFGSGVLALPGLAAVLIFYVLSGFVLARSYNGRPLVFIARRFVRLWPLYAVCLVAGHLAQMSPLPLPELFWSPGYFPAIDPPMWSLRYEAWATPVLPLLFLILPHRRWTGFALACLLVVLGWKFLDLRLISAGSIIAGISASRFSWRPNQQPSAITLWLGKVSFSLYLTHQITLTAAEHLAGPWGSVAALPLAFFVAWMGWWTIERPSIYWSRRIGRRTRVPVGSANSSGMVGAERPC